MVAAGGQHLTDAEPSGFQSRARAPSCACATSTTQHDVHARCCGGARGGGLCSGWSARPAPCAPAQPARQPARMWRLDGRWSRLLEALESSIAEEICSPVAAPGQFYGMRSPRNFASASVFHTLYLACVLEGRDRELLISLLTVNFTRWTVPGRLKFRVWTWLS